MGKSVRGLASVAVLVGSIGTLLLADAGEAVGPGIKGFNSGGSGASPRNGKNNFSAPTPTTLKRQGDTSSQSGPTTFGYWDGSSFVRTPGPWTAPDGGPKGTNQRPR